MSVAEMKKQVIDYIQKVENENLIAEIMKQIQALDAKFNHNLKAEDVFNKARNRYDDVLKKLAQ